MLRLAAFADPPVITPGETFDVVWAVCADAGDPPAPPVTRLSLSLAGTPLFPVAADSGAPRIIRIDRARLGAAAAGFYRQRALQAISTVVTLADGRVLMADARVRVLLPSLAGAVLAFTGPATRPSVGSHYPGDVRLARWKEAYTVAVDMVNPLGFAQVTLTLSLNEVENERERPTGVVTNVPAWTPTPVRMHIGTLAPGETRALNFDPTFLKDWTWLLDNVWIVNGPVVRGFTYHVRLTGTDEFGNVYPAADSSQIRVEVEVSAEKLSNQMSAAGLMVLAGVLMVAGIVLTSAKVAAGVAQAAARGFGMAAKDPPDPDPAFRKRIKPPQPRLDREFARDPRVPRLRSWLEAAQQGSASRLALYEIEAKVLGALQAQDRKAEQLQVGDFVAQAGVMLAAATKLRTTASAVARELEGSLDLDALRERLKVWSTGSPPRDELAAVAGFLPPEALWPVVEALKGVDAERLDLERLLDGIGARAEAGGREFVEDYLRRYRQVLLARGEDLPSALAQFVGDVKA